MNLYTKYSNSITISYNEILNDFSQIKPTFNPILDICTIKTLGSYITNKINYEQWQNCPNLIDELMIGMNLAISKCKKPSYTINEVSYQVSDIIKASLDMNNPLDVSKYFEMKTKYNEYLDQIKLKYTDGWDDIEKQYENITNILMENFSELENDLNFEATIEIIDSISNEASKKIEILIKEAAILIKENGLTSQIKIDFDKCMDEIYEQVVASKKFDKVIHDIMIDMFGVEKAIHRMSLSLENCLRLLKMI
jgi:hypothetical protein